LIQNPDPFHNSTIKTTKCNFSIRFIVVHAKTTREQIAAFYATTNNKSWFVQDKLQVLKVGRCGCTTRMHYKIHSAPIFQASFYLHIVQCIQNNTR